MPEPPPPPWQVIDDSISVPESTDPETVARHEAWRLEVERRARDRKAVVWEWSVQGWGGVGVDCCARCEKTFVGPAYVIDGLWGREYYCTKCVGRRRHALPRPEPCVVCGREFTWVGGQVATPPVGIRSRPRPRVHLCSEDCRREHRNRARRVRHEEERPCAGCRRSFIPTRGNQLYHSAACRQRAYRKRRAAS